MRYKVLFVGPIAGVDEPAPGGYQASNRRTIDGLRRLCLSVTEVPYPRRLGRHGRAARYFYLPSYVAQWVVLTLRLIIGLALSRPGRVIVHLTAMYGRFAYPETCLAIITKIFRARLIYDIRAGSMVHTYNRKHSFYRWIIRLFMKLSDSVMVEGQEYNKFVTEITGKPPYYLPNYVDSSLLADDLARQKSSADGIKLIYFGRLAAEKGVPTILDCCGSLRDQGVRFSLTLIGSVGAGFLEQIRRSLNHLGLSDCVNISPPLKFSELTEYLNQAHYFLFPTQWLGEGQSNALTEAMAFGAVPICSRHGFNASLVGPCGVVLPTSASGDDYARAIKEIWESGRWPEISRCCRERVAQLFCSDAVLPGLAAHYERVLSQESTPPGQGAG